MSETVLIAGVKNNYSYNLLSTVYMLGTKLSIFHLTSLNLRRPYEDDIIM